MSNIVYTAVVKDKTILATFSQTNIDLEPEIQKLLSQPLSKTEQRRMNYYIFTIYKLTTLNLTFVCASPNDQFDLNPQLPFTYLEVLSNRWLITYGDSVTTSGKGSLTQSSQGLFQTALNTVLTSSKTDQMKKSLDETQKLLTNSVKLALERGEDLQELSNQADNLMSTSEDFRNQSINLKNAMRCSHYKSLTTRILLLIFLLYFVLTILCGGMTLQPRCL